MSRFIQNFNFKSKKVKGVFISNKNLELPFFIWILSFCFNCHFYLILNIFELKELEYNCLTFCAAVIESLSTKLVGFMFIYLDEFFNISAISHHEIILSQSKTLKHFY